MESCPFLSIVTKINRRTIVCIALTFRLSILHIFDLLTGVEMHKRPSLNYCILSFLLTGLYKGPANKTRRGYQGVGMISIDCFDLLF